MKRVVIFQYRSLHYRVGLFEQLRQQCAIRGIDLHLVHGQPTRRELAKKDVGSVPWADVVTNTVVRWASAIGCGSLSPRTCAMQIWWW